MEEKRSPIFEDVFDLIGHVGYLQVCLYIFGCIIETAVSMSILFYAFEYANPGWTCSVVTTNLSLGNTSYNTTPFGNESVLHNYCPKEPNICINVTFGDEYTSISTEWGFICEKRYLGRLTASCYFVGVLIGTGAYGYFSDNFGRKKTVAVGWILLVLSQTISGFSTVWAMYLPTRFIAGIMAGGASTVAMILPLEYFGPKYRIIPSIRWGWQLGGFALALVGHLIRRWQYIAMASGLLTLPFIPLFAMFMPESARWSMQKGRMKEAKHWIRRIAKHNRRPEPDLSILDEIAVAENDASRKEASLSYLDLFRTKHYAMLSLALCVAWFHVSFVAYGIIGDMEMLTGNIYLNLALMNVGLCGLTWLIIPLANRFGRIKTFLVYETGLSALVLVVMVLALVDSKKYGAYITYVIVFSTFWQAGIWSSLFIITNENFPTLLRTRAFALSNVASRIAGIIAPQIGLLTVFHTSIPYIIFLVTGLLSMALVYICVPETNNKPLTEEIPIRKKKDKRASANDCTQDGTAEMLVTSTTA